MEIADFLNQCTGITVRRTYVWHVKVSATCETVKILIRNSTIIRKSVPSVPSIKCKFINILLNLLYQCNNVKGTMNSRFLWKRSLTITCE